jgi:hypothetical protein
MSILVEFYESSNPQVYSLGAKFRRGALLPDELCSFISRSFRSIVRESFLLVEHEKVKHQIR